MQIKPKYRTLGIYLLAMLAMIAAVTLRLMLIPVIGTNTAYLTVFPTVALTAIILGTGPALFAAIMGVVISELWAFSSTEFLSLAQFVRGSASLVTGIAVGYLSNKLKNARQRAEIQADLSHQSESELKRTTGLLRTILESTPDLIFAKDLQGKYIVANPATINFFKKIINVDIKNLEELNYNSKGIGRDKLSPNDQKVAESGKSQVFEEEMKIGDITHTFLSTKTPLFNEQNKIVGVIGVSREITERKKAEDDLKKTISELQAAKEAAEVANNERLNFLATMSHELRTPLSVILGFTDVLAENDIAPSERAKIISTVKKNGDLLTRLIDEILDLSKIESGKVELELMDVNLIEVMADVTGILSHQAQKKGLVLSTSIEGSLPEKIVTDPTRVRQILTNLIGNSIKFTSKGWIKITAAADQKNKQIRFLIEDTGEGITPANQVKIFEPFVQADSSYTRRFGGTGLGLSLSKKIAQSLGGDVVLLKSSPQEGSAFLATIELKDSNGKTETTPVFNHLTADQRKDQLDGVNVLVTDDVIDNQLLVERFLAASGAHVELANSGAEAIQKVKTSNFDVILMDIQMPEMDGYEATKNLRKIGCQAPIIALTAYAMRSDREKALRSGFNDYLPKPIKKADLIATILKNTHVDKTH